MGFQGIVNFSAQHIPASTSCWYGWLLDNAPASLLPTSSNPWMNSMRTEFCSLLSLQDPAWGLAHNICRRRWMRKMLMNQWYLIPGCKKSPYDADYRKANQRRRGLTMRFCCTVMVLILILSVSCSCWSWYTEQWANGLSWWELGLGTRKTLKWSPSSGLMFCIYIYIFLYISDVLFSFQILMFLKAQLILKQRCTFNEVCFLLVSVKQLWNQWWVPCQWHFGTEVILFVALGKVFVLLSPNLLICKRAGL